MHKKIFMLATIFIWAIFFSEANAEGIWRLDASNAYKLPVNFRADDDLHISGSGQPSIAGMAMLHDELCKKIAGAGKIYLVDLRQESHGYFLPADLEGYPVSYYTEKNLANFFRGNDEVEDIEIELLTDMLGAEVNLLPLGNFDKKYLRPVSCPVDGVRTERDLATDWGFEYVRFPVTDMYFPAPDVVDAFIQFVANLNENDWVHFHCQGGLGRTTTFMAMYEILKNPDKSLGEICQHQADLGGTYLLERKVGDPKDYYIQAHDLRAENLIEFFFYVRGVQREEIGLQWSEYILTRNH